MSLVVSAKFSPATLLSQVEQDVTHDCMKIIDQAYPSRPDLKSQRLHNPDEKFI